VLVGRDFVSNICKLKPKKKLKTKNLKNCYKKLVFFQPCYWLISAVADVDCLAVELMIHGQAERSELTLIGLSYHSAC